MKLIYTEEETAHLNRVLATAIDELRQATHPQVLQEAQTRLQIILTMGFLSNQWDEARTALVESIGL